MRRPWLIIIVAAAVALVSLSTAPAEHNPARDSKTGATRPIADLPVTRVVPDSTEVVSDVTPVTPDTLSADVAFTTGVTSSYDIQWESVNAGGGPAAGGSYRVNGSAGQSAIGAMSGGSYAAGIGYWYGAGAVPQACACDCHADPECDGVANVLDVVKVVNIAFRGTTDTADPNPLCPYTRADADCSMFINVIDVVKFVNVTFRGGDPGVEFCQPCAP